MKVRLLQRIFAFLLCIGYFTAPAYADKCKDPTVDEVSGLSSDDTARIQSAMNKLVLLGADVRVQVLSSYHRNGAGEMNASLLDYKKMMQAKCSPWQAPDGGMKNNLILFLIAPKQQDTAIYYGSQYLGQLRSHDTATISDMNARFRDGDLAGGIIQGLTTVYDLVSIKVADRGKSVVINNPADFSGLWSFFKWMLALAAFGGIGYAIYFAYRRYTDGREAQRAAQTERAKCTTAMNGYETPLAVLKSKIATASVGADWKWHIANLVAKTEKAFAEAAGAFNALSRSANDPSTGWLSAVEYNGMASRYAHVAKLFATANDSLVDAQHALERAIAGEPLVRSTIQQEAGGQDNGSKKGNGGNRRGSSLFRQRSSGRGGERGNASATPQTQPTPQPQGNGIERHDTTVIVVDRDNNDPLRYDDPSWRSRRREEPDVPVIVEPADPQPSRSSQGDGTSGRWGDSGDGGGASTLLGTSGDGDGVSGKWEGGRGTQY